MNTYWKSGGIAPLILGFSTRWRWVVSFTPLSLYLQGKSPWYPLDRRLGGPQSRSGRGSEEKNSQPLPGLEPSNIQPVAQRYTTELTRLPWYNMLSRWIRFNTDRSQWNGSVQQVLPGPICSFCNASITLFTGLIIFQSLLRHAPRISTAASRLDSHSERTGLESRPVTKYPNWDVWLPWTVAYEFR
jgi:hypothetical protein